MSVAMWCDPGKHAFSGNDEGIETLTRTRRGKDDRYPGQTVDQTITIHICSEHMKKIDPFNEHNEEKEAKVIESRVDPEKIENLEAWKDGYEKGRESAM